MSSPLTTVILGIVAVHIGFLYIFSAVYEWAWFYQGRGWSPYYALGRENTLALFKAFGGVCYACGFLFVSLTLVQNEMWPALAGLVLHSGLVLLAGLSPKTLAFRRAR
jgi:hypothetical protein